jgi:drug/metabolite transporter (DMT)-like permease
MGARYSPKCFGLLVSFLGVMIAVLPALGVEVTREAILAVVLILVAEMGCVFGTIKSKKILAGGLSPFLLNGWQMLIGGMILVLLSMIVEPAGVVMNDQVIFSWVYLVICGFPHWAWVLLLVSTSCRALIAFYLDLYLTRNCPICRLLFPSRICVSLFISGVELGT